MKNIVTAMICLTSSLVAESSAQFTVGGMSCGGCASGINEGFGKDLAKYKVHVDYKSAIMNVQRKDGSDVNVKEIQAALEEMGFKGSLVK